MDEQGNPLNDDIDEGVEEAGAGHPEDAMEEEPAEVQNRNQFEPEAELAELVIVERELAMENDDNEEEWDSTEDEQDQELSSAEDEHQQPYELALSSRHEYLGDTEEVSGRTVVSADDCITLPILSPNSTRNLVLLPSQTLPLTIFCPMQQSMLRNVIAKDKIIGIIHKRLGSSGDARFDLYGTTAEIYEYHAEDDGPSLSVKAKGRQRFKVISTHRETTGCVVARVRILPEIRMPDPLHYVRLTAQLRRSSVRGHNEAGQKLQLRDVGSVRSASSWKARRHASMLTAWPAWVYDLYDDEQLAVRLVNEIVSQFNMLQGTLQIPRDPQELSHWAAVNLPLTNSQRLSLLSLNTATQRLRFILCVVSQTSKGLFCRYCGHLLAHASSVFCMSTDGPQGTFVNPDGYIHEMITLTKVNHVSTQGKAFTRHSWFPGYSWKIADCSTCRSHVGWLFTAEKNLKPRTFYGITRGAVKTRITEETNPLLYVI